MKPLSSVSCIAPALAAEPDRQPISGQDTARHLLTMLDAAPAPARASRSLSPAAESCKDKCEADQDTCFKSCPDDAIPGAVCRDACTDTYDKCVKGC